MHRRRRRESAALLVRVAAEPIEELLNRVAPWSAVQGGRRHVGVAGYRRPGSGGLGLEIRHTARLEPSRSVNKPRGVSALWLVCPLPTYELVTSA